MSNMPAALTPHIDALRDIVGPTYVMTDSTDAAPYLRDWTGDYVADIPCVVFPASTAEVSAVMRYAFSHGQTIHPQGGNSGLVSGSQASAPDTGLILNLKRMSKIRELSPADYTATVEAGCIVQTLQEAAKADNRLFPLSFGAEGSAQIGGALSTNAGGLNVLRYGMARDLVLGLEVVLMDGTILNALSQLRKDNRGLDLKQMFLGTEGALGIITAASLKLFPATTSRETAFLAVGSVSEAVALFDLARSYCADLLTAFELIPRPCLEMAIAHQSGLRDPLEAPSEWYVLMDLTCSGPLQLRPLIEGFLEAAMTKELVHDGVLAENLTQVHALWAIREAMVEAQVTKGRHLRTDISVPLSKISAFIDAAHQTLSEHAPGWIPLSYGHVGDGNIHFNALPPSAMAEDDRRHHINALLPLIYDVVDGLNGSISAEHGIGRARLAPHLARQPEAQRQLTQQIKALLDPTGQMNPGCLIPLAPNSDDTRDR
ncbi:MAG: FAD-binding oxidoreductase [Thalassovita sp.]